MNKAWNDMEKQNYEYEYTSFKMRRLIESKMKGGNFNEKLF